MSVNTLLNKTGTDKVLHLTVSTTIAHLLIVVGCAWWLAGVITLSIGIGKEIYDKVSGKGTSEWEDIAADIIGTVIGIL